MASQCLRIASVLTLSALCAAHAFSKDSDTNLQTPACLIPLAPPKVSDGQSAFDIYSWNMFVALNWPASSTQRGEPDCTKPLSTNIPRVWQTYKRSDEVFLATGLNPGSWQSGYGTSNNVPIIKQISKASKTTVVEGHQEAVGGWLIDQSTNPTYFQMWVNKNWYNYVLNNKLYNKDNFSNKTAINLPWNAAEIKSAWKILTSRDTAEDYIRQKSNIAEFDSSGKPTGKTQSVTLGLVGLHITYKPQGYPQWIWATFEHVNNVPPSQYDSNSGKVVSKPLPGVNYTYFNANASNPNQSPCDQSNPSTCQPFTTLTPLTRLTPIRNDALTTNTEYQTKHVQGTVLANYQLITTQWPAQPNNPAALWGDPTPTISANSTMESYIQTSSNCMNCHGMATLPGLQIKSDFSFLFNEAHSQIVWKKSLKK